MIRHSTRILVEVVIGVVAGILILAGIGIWRLSTGPAPVDFLTPRLEAAFNEAVATEAGERVSLSIGETVLTWEGWGRTIDLRARRTTVTDTRGVTLARLPDVSVTLSLRALLQGVIAPTAVEVIEPSLVLIRRPDGEIAFGHGEPDAAEPRILEGQELSRTLPALVEQLLSEPDPAKPLAFLDTVRLVDGNLTIRDETRGLSWRARAVSLGVRSSKGGLAGEGGLQLVQDRTPADVRFAFVYDSDSARVELASSFAGLRPDAFEALAPDPLLLAGLDLAFSGKASSRLALDGKIESASFEIGGGPGRLALADLFPEPRPLQDLLIRGSYGGPWSGLNIEAAEIRFGTLEAPGPTLAAEGDLRWLDEDLRITGTARASGLVVEQLGDYWPRGLSENGRDWIVENITAGSAEEAILNFDLTVPAGDFAAAEVAVLDGTLSYSNLEVHYLRPMPPVNAVSGIGSFDRNGMSLQATGGHIDGLEALETNISITGFQDPDQTIDINLPVTGSLRDVLTLLDHQRLRLVERLGIDPQATEGLAAARARFAFPLINDLKLDDVVIEAKANLTGVAVGNLLLGKDARNGKLSLDLTKDSMQIVGGLTLGPLPVQIDWTEDFSGNAAERSLIKALASSVSDQQRAAFGFDILPRQLHGPVAASVVAQLRRDDSASIKLALNLQDTALDASFLGWEKPAGVPGEARATLQLQGERLVGLDSLSVSAGSLALEGSGRFDQEGRLASLALQQLAYGHTALSDVEVAIIEDGYDVRIGGGVLDAEPLLGHEDDGEQAEAETDEAPPAIRLGAPNLRSLRLGEGRSLEGVSLALERDAGGWQLFRLSGSLPRALWTGERADAATDGEAAVESPRVDINYAPVRPGLHKLTVTGNDLGGTLRAFDILDTVRGGKLEISGEEPAGEALRARVEAKDFTVVEAPTLARLLLVASLTGVVEGLRGEGISFDRLIGEVAVKDGVITSDLVRAYGTSLGLTAKGQLDIGRSEVDIEGTIVPAYLLNRILGEIPLLGPLLTGGEGQGFVAFTYTMNGSLEDPDISVNPLSALAPGSLRSLFGGDFKDSGPVDLPSGGNR
ncbi:MAG: AsmA-like C-terminal domain-containing protein [Kiloniellales bacterium]